MNLSPTIVSQSSRTLYAESIRVRGIVQGVGFRPMVWKLAQQFQLMGEVKNDGEGVLIYVVGQAEAINSFIDSLATHSPALARIDCIERQPAQLPENPVASFEIIHSTHSSANTGITADAATCEACLEDVFSSSAKANRRHCYPFTNCTHCGPRLSIIRGVPYDRAQTSMAAFTLCAACLREYQSADDRRFHAQPNACPACGPEVWLEDNNGKKIATANKQKNYHDMPILQAALLIREKAIVAIKGIGGIHLAVCACDEGSGDISAVQKLREKKQRPRKPFAIMVRDIAMAEQYCYMNDAERTLLKSHAAPIVLLQKRETVSDGELLAEEIAAGQNTLGVMLPYTPLHHLLLHVLNKPIVLTSGNQAHEPQCIDNDHARHRLTGLADYYLLHNRDIENRVDDSVVRLMGDKPQFYRRARGYAPESLPLPQGFEHVPDILAMGGELKNTFCVLKNGQAILSQHMGDLENYATYDDYRHNLALYEKLFQHQAKHIATDAHPDYISSKLGEEIAEERSISLHTIQHHHAHIAACLADNAYPLEGECVLGIALDGLGYGLGYGQAQSNHPLWGGEFLLADYRQSTQLAYFKPIALLGGSMAMGEPWRNTYAHLHSCLGWDWVSSHYAQLDVVKRLAEKPLQTFDAMLEKGMNCPLASSAGRLFDAVAAALGICTETLQYEGQAAIELEAQITPQTWAEAQTSAYSFSFAQHVLDPTPMWQALLNDLSQSVSIALMSARFHQGLSVAIQQLAVTLMVDQKLKTIVLSGGVFQNKTLFEAVKTGLVSRNVNVLYHQNVPANDGGLALGQAVITAARLLSPMK